MLFLKCEELNSQSDRANEVGYWTSDRFIQLMEKAVEILDSKYPKSEVMDDSSLCCHTCCHTAYAME